MKNIAVLFLLIASVFTGYHCNTSAGGGASSSSDSMTVTGKLEGAGGMQLYLDQIAIASARPNHIVANTTANANGTFTFDLKENVDPGIYNLRAGVQKIFLILDGTENTVDVQGNVATINQFQYEVTGSEATKEFMSAIQGLVKKTMKTEEVKTFVETSSSPLAAAAVATMALNDKRFVPTHKSAQDRLEKTYPGTKYVSDYSTFIGGLNKVRGGRGFQYIAEGERQEAPNITATDPDGKEYSLEDLEGKVVLLDFWASWCGPCRRENPNVVKIYKKYKEQGFTVFSVSLDGLDSRSKARYGGDATQIEKALAAQKKRWEDAIAKDQLEWEYHVSNLQKWECPSAKQYSVSSIPRTFMIDREGKIAAVNLRGEQIEETLKQLL